MSPIRSKFLAAALAVATAISVLAAIIGGVAAHRADDRADLLAAELEEERAARVTDFEAMEVLLSHPGLSRTVWPDFDTERWVWDGVDGYDGDTTPHPVPGLKFLTEHRCPAGQVVSPEDVDRLEELAAAAEWVTEEGSIMLPSVIDVVGVRCVPAAG